MTATTRSISSCTCPKNNNNSKYQTFQHAERMKTEEEQKFRNKVHRRVKCLLTILIIQRIINIRYWRMRITRRILGREDFRKRSWRRRKNWIRIMFKLKDKVIRGFKTWVFSKRYNHRFKIYTYWLILKSKLSFKPRINHRVAMALRNPIKI